MEPLITVVIEVVARYYGTDPASILSGRRHQSTIIARHTAIYIARLVGDFSYSQIAEIFKRDHTSVMNACKRMALRAAKIPSYQEAVTEMVREVQGLGITGGKVKIRKEILTLLEARLKLGIFGHTIEDIVDRILCEHFQRELTKK
jgi:hypothetical protein